MEIKGAAILVFVLAMLLAGRMYPFAPVIGGIRRIIRNFSLAALNAVLSALVVIPVSAFAALWALDWRPPAWGGWTGLALDVAALDLWIYWWHRANHEIPFLWRFHEVHHLDETLDASSALRFHFGEVFLSSLSRAAVIFLLGVPIASVVVFETIVALAAIFHHSNARIPPRIERAMAHVIVTPSIHWVHHHAKRSDTDSNYATFLSAWDFLFRSRSETARTAEMPIGVEGLRDRGLLDLIRRPFSRGGN
jgi:sterol desaturase/sphingolipid hydroxylase (fatty acid hydroxylase superfamily)